MFPYLFVAIKGIFFCDINDNASNVTYPFASINMSDILFADSIDYIIFFLNYYLIILFMY